MIKENLKMVIREFHESAIPDLIKRKTLFDVSTLHSPINKVVTIIGPRRAGKTYFLFQIMKALMRKGFHLTDILYINFDFQFGFTKVFGKGIYIWIIICFNISVKTSGFFIKCTKGFGKDSSHSRINYLHFYLVLQANGQPCRIVNGHDSSLCT